MDRLPHEYGDWTVQKEATCTEKGLRSRTCEVCGHVQEQEIDMLPHDYKWKTIEKATRQPIEAMGLIYEWKKKIQ